MTVDEHNDKRVEEKNKHNRIKPIQDDKMINNSKMITRT